MPHFLNTQDAGFEAAFTALLGMKREDSPDVDATVAAIIADVRARGDAAVIELTARFDRLELTPDRKLARENAAEVMQNLGARGFHLQFPPSTAVDPLSEDWGTDA